MDKAPDADVKEAVDGNGWRWVSFGEAVDALLEEQWGKRMRDKKRYGGMPDDLDVSTANGRLKISLGEMSYGKKEMRMIVPYPRPRRNLLL